MQNHSGVHCQFFSLIRRSAGEMRRYGRRSGKEKISAGYFRLIRNYYRFGRVILICLARSGHLPFLSRKESQPHTVSKRTAAYYLPYATSLFE